MIVFLLVVGTIAVLGGVVMLSNATMGVGVVAFGCFMGICARIAQASQHQKELLRAMHGDPVDDALPRRSTAPKEDGRIVCPSCGYRNTATRTTCHQCGLSLPDPTLAPAPAAGPSSLAN
jgi:uncharacterized paraquat-inducible protein A